MKMPHLSPLPAKENLLDLKDWDRDMDEFFCELIAGHEVANCRSEIPIDTKVEDLLRIHGNLNFSEILVIFEHHIKQSLKNQKPFTYSAKRMWKY